jgi:hypothetical protein
VRRISPALPLASAALVVALVATAPVRSTQALAAPKPSAITFSSPSVVDPTNAYGEPDVKIAPDGAHWYDSGPWGTGTQRSIWNESTDGGRTFHTLHAPAITSPNQSATTVPCPPGSLSCPGGGDTEISISRTGEVYYADLAALVTLKTATWDPTAHAMTTGIITNGEENADGIDRQWFALWDPATPPAGYTGPLPVNYLTAAEAAGALDCDPPALGGCAQASYSTDGVTYSDPALSWPLSNDGPLVIDQQTGTVIEAISVESLSDVGVAILTRDPASPSDPALKNAQVVKIADLPPNTTTRALFPVIAFDTNRTAYVAWVTRGDNGQSSSEDPNAWQIWYSYASVSSGWTSWSAPKQLSASPSNTNVMPWAVAGSAGRLAVVWYGTSDNAHDPSTADVHQPWDVYMAMVRAADTTAPVVTQVKVTRHPLHYGTICLEGTGCITVQGNRNLADFFQVTMDPLSGAAVITYNDTSNELVQQVPPIPEGFVDHRGAPVVMVVRQNGGTGLLGTTVAGDPSSGTSMTDAAGDARFDPAYAGTSVPELDIQKVTVANQKGTNNVVITLDVTSLDVLQHAFDVTGAAAVEYVARWTGPAVTDQSTGLKNPIYYASVEVQPGGVATYVAGAAQSVDLCSVSACTPHIVNYPAPPQGGTLVTGQLKLGRPGATDQWIITVPRAVIGNPPVGSTFESFGAYTLARNHTAGLTLTQTEGEAGITPVEIDGVCCREAKV